MSSMRCLFVLSCKQVSRIHPPKPFGQAQHFSKSVLACGDRSRQHTEADDPLVTRTSYNVPPLFSHPLTSSMSALAWRRVAASTPPAPTTRISPANLPQLRMRMRGWRGAHGGIAGHSTYRYTTICRAASFASARTSCSVLSSCGIGASPSHRTISTQARWFQVTTPTPAAKPPAASTPNPQQQAKPRPPLSGPLQQPRTPPPPPPQSPPPQPGQLSNLQWRILLLLGGGAATWFIVTSLDSQSQSIDPAQRQAQLRHAVEEEFKREHRMTIAEAREAQAKEEDPLADHKLPALIKEHRKLSWLNRMWFYVRLVVRGTVLTVIWTPVLTLGLILPTSLWMTLVTHTLEWSGPVFIKLGQWASTRPDLFAAEICAAMTRLQAEVASHKYKVSIKTCQANFGKELVQDGMQLIVEEQVLGSGSMGQVHHGYVVNQSTGERTEVAIKILHPNIHSHVNRDLTLLYYVTALITMIPYSELQWVSIPEMLIQFTGFMSSHLDLKQEARNMERFREYFARDPNISFPAPMYPFVGAQVLTQSLADGISLGKFLNGKDLDRTHMDAEDPRNKSIAERITKAHIQRHEEAVREAQKTGANVPLPPFRHHASPLHSEIARLGLQMYLHMLIRDNFVHSDLHPGNILVQLPGLVNGKFSGDVEDLVHKYDDSSSEFLKSRHVNLVILDSGLVSELNRKNRKNFLSLFGALILVRPTKLRPRPGYVDRMLTRVFVIC